MNNNDYTAPMYKLNWFNCPHCWAFSNQNWYVCGYQHWSDWYKLNFLISICDHCKKICLWDNEKQEMMRPNILTAPLPNEDMPDDVKELYEEAKQTIPTT